MVALSNKIFKFTMSEAYDYWQKKLGKSSEKRGAKAQNQEDSEEEIDEDFSNDFEDSEV